MEHGEITIFHATRLSYTRYLVVPLLAWYVPSTIPKPCGPPCSLWWVLHLSHAFEEIHLSISLRPATALIDNPTFTPAGDHPTYDRGSVSPFSEPPLLNKPAPLSSTSCHFSEPPRYDKNSYPFICITCKTALTFFGTNYTYCSNSVLNWCGTKRAVL